MNARKRTKTLDSKTKRKMGRSIVTMIEMLAGEVDQPGSLETIVTVGQKARKEVEEDLGTREVVTQAIDPKETRDFIQVILVLEIGDQCMKGGDTPGLGHQIEAIRAIGAEEVDLEVTIGGAQAQRSILGHEVDHKVKAEEQEMNFMPGVQGLP